MRRIIIRRETKRIEKFNVLLREVNESDFDTKTALYREREKEREKDNYIF